MNVEFCQILYFISKQYLDFDQRDERFQYLFVWNCENG